MARYRNLGTLLVLIVAVIAVAGCSTGPAPPQDTTKRPTTVLKTNALSPFVTLRLQPASRAGLEIPESLSHSNDLAIPLTGSSRTYTI